ARHADLVRHQAAREFCRRDEFRDLSDVLRFLRALSALEGAGGQPPALLCLPVQSVHPCGRVDTLCPVRKDQLDLAGRGRRLHGGFHDRRDIRLRPIARPDPPRARGRRDMRRQIAIVALLLLAASNEFVLAADPRYPDWPCTQAKVPEISLAAVWAGPPLNDIKGKWKDDAKVSALVPKLAARRTSIEDGQKAIAEFLGSSADKATAGKLLF